MTFLTIKLVHILGRKEKEYFKGKFNELATKNTKRNIRHLYRGIKEFNLQQMNGTKLSH